ncbi:MAG: Ty3/Gypsy family RNase HI domain-containing protein, partial [Cohaesibacter sp.]|nr:Ty3/Gypsy family RNase HI domain-containing protein [Cohaesibacter sp.]
MVWAIGKWRHYLEGTHFIVQTDHSSLRHLPNQPSVNRRIWKWVSILQGYDLEIRHIPGKVNPADALTRQAKGSDERYAGEVKRQDADWVQEIRVAENASDSEIQSRLKQLYNSDDSNSKAVQAV